MKVIVTLLGLILYSNVLAQDDIYRLPPNYKINHYDIDLIVPTSAFTGDSSNYSGSVTIDFQVTVSTSEVKLHASNSNIEVLEIILDGTIEPSSFSQNETTDILTIQFESALEVGRNYSLAIKFNANLLGGGGFYKVSYEDHEGVTQYLATTQFQATSARNAFPCFDEPTYRATFAFNLTYPNIMNAWTNSISLKNDTETYADQGLIKTEFDITPRMSSYLVAFTIAKYTCSEGILEGSAENYHRTCSRMDKETEREWSMEVTPKVIESLNSFTGINYTKSILKLDQMAVPGKSGAMENWGLVIYGESSLLYNSSLQNTYNKQGIAGIISHELAHQWFGNLVTCKWWSETFLNEGFATYFQYFTTHEILPSYEMDKQFVVRIVQPMLLTDGELDAPALRTNASSPSEVSSTFNRYSYYKGGAIFRMIELMLGTDYFKQGITKYLNDNEYQPVEPQNLWNAFESVIENAAGILPGASTFSEVIDNWINKGGYPVLNVALNGSSVTISQERFLYAGEETENTTWYVPVTFSTPDTNDGNLNITLKGWLTPTQDYSFSLSDANSWIVVNNQQRGFYRVNYDSTLWQSLATALKQTNFSGIHELNRAQVVDDSSMLARAGKLSYKQALTNVEFLAQDTNYISWFPATSFFTYLISKIDRSSSLGVGLTNHYLRLLEFVSQTVPLTTVDEANQIFTLKQVLISTAACKYGNTDCIAAAKQLFEKYKTTGERPNINNQEIVYCNAIRYSDSAEEDWNFLYNQYQNSPNASDSSYIWTGLGCATNTTVLTSFLQKIIESDGFVSSSLYSSIFSTIYSANEVGVETAMDFIINNFDSLNKTYSDGNQNLSNVITGMASYISKTSQIEKLESFLSNTSLSSDIINAINATLTTAKDNQAIISSIRSDLEEYLAELETTTSTPTTDSPGGGSFIRPMQSIAFVAISAMIKLY